MPKRQLQTPFTSNPVSIPVRTPKALNINQHRVNIYKFTPNDSVAGRHRLDEIDRFYIECQRHRDFYKDLSGQYQPQFFARYKQFATRPDPTSTYLNIMPAGPYKERKPVAYPLTMGRRGLNSLRTRFG